MSPTMYISTGSSWIQSHKSGKVKTGTFDFSFAPPGVTVPVLTASYYVPSGGNNTATLTTPSFTPANGEVIVVKLETWDTAVAMNAPTGGGQTYAARGISAPGGFKPWAGLYTTVVTGTPGAMTISASPVGTCRHSMVVERWSNARLATVPTAVAATGSSLPSSVSKGAFANSVLSWVMGDSNSRDPANSTYLNSATQTGLDDGHVGANGVAYYAYQAVATMDTWAMGVTNTGGALAFSFVGVEILPASGTAQSLYIPNQDEPSNAFDEGSGLTLGTGFVARRPGVVTHGKFRFPPSPSGTYQYILYETNLNESGAGGVERARATFSSTPAGAWGTVPLGYPISAGGGGSGVGYYGAVYSTAGKYAATSNYFTSAGKASSDLYAWQSGENLLGDIGRTNGRFRAADAYPTQSFNDGNYYVDVVFVAS